MTERPILFSAPMVRAILAGQKMQTRRVMKTQPDDVLDGQPYWWVGGYRAWPYTGDTNRHRQTATPMRCPYGQPGTKLWVRETFIHEPADYCWAASVSIPCRPALTVYRADFPDSQPGEGWKPSIHMPRSLSRITLRITGVRVERLQDISEADAQAEGAPSADLASGRECIFQHQGTHRWGFQLLWQSINGPGSWDANPWVWVVSFERVEA